MSVFSKLFGNDFLGVKRYSKSVRFKFVFWFIAIGAVPTIGIGGYALYQGFKLAEKSVIQDQSRVLAGKLHDLGNHLNEMQIDLQDLSSRLAVKKLLQAIASKDAKRIERQRIAAQEDFAEFANFHRKYAQIQFIDGTGNEIIHIDFFDESGSVIRPRESLADVSAEPYFKDTLSAQDNEVTILPLMAFEPDSSRQNFDAPMIRFGSSLVTTGGHKVGVLILTAMANSFLKPFGKLDRGKMMLVDESGHFLYHPDPKIRLTWKTSQDEERLQEYYSRSVFRDLLKKKSGYLRVSSEFIIFKTFNYDAQNPNKIWFGILSRDKDALLEPIRNFRNQLLLLILAFLILIVSAAPALGRRLAEPLAKLVETAKHIANYNFKHGKLNFRSEDEIGTLARTFDTMVDNLCDNLGNIAGTATTLTQSFAEITSALQEQSSLTAQQSSSVTEITATLEELTASSSQIAENSNSVVDISANALRQTELGVSSIQELKEKIDQIGKDNEESTREIIELGKKSREITKVMEIINNITDQTKLIAFNAAIEASSAGEAGKRFGVVAVEIRRLADNVMRSTGEIANRIDEIQQAINRLVIASEKGANRIDEGTSLGAQTLDQLEHLLDGAKSTTDSATQISLSTQEQKTATGQVLDALREIEMGIHQSSTSIKQTASITNELANYSEAMKKMVGRFKFDETS